MGSAVIAMEVAALVVGYLAFGWGVLLAGAPLLLGTVLLLAVVLMSEGRRRRQPEWYPAAPDAPSPGLMSGFFEIPAQRGPVPVPGAARTS